MATDLYNNAKFVRVIAPFDPSATGTVTGTVIDRAGFNSITFAIMNGAVSTSGFSMTPVVKSGSATGSLTAVPDADLIGTEAGATISGGTSDNQVAKIGYIGQDRYVTCDLVIAGAATGFHAVVGVLGSPSKMPQATQKA
jgi:hypothetical protein